MTNDEKWQKRLDRERFARETAESLLEQKSTQLYDANLKLEQRVLAGIDRYRQEERKLRAIFDSSVDGIVLHNSYGKIISVNHALCDLLESPEEKLVGHSIHRFLKRDGQTNSLLDSINEGDQESGEAPFDCELITASGNYIPCEVSANSFELEGELVVQGIIRDITYRYQSQLALERATQVAIEANEAKSMFLATMSHEIRTPLNGIIGFTDLMSEDVDKPEHIEYLNLIKRSGKMLLAIINDILDFSKIESCQMELEEMDYNLSDCIRGVVDLQSQRAQDKGISLNYEVDQAVPLGMRGDSGRVQQVLTNLISNAIKFTQEGSVTITARMASESFLEIAVADTGIGFDQGVRDKLFLAFQQADASTTRKFGGTGLGLAICRELVELMGGDIRAESSPGQGATFYILLPHNPSKTAVKSTQSTDQEKSKLLDGDTSTNKRVALVVEDNSINIKLISIILERLNLTVHVAHNGKEALDALRLTASYDVVLMDMQMPVMDGLEASRQIRAGTVGAAYQNIPIIAMTANAMKDHEIQCLSAGMSHFVPKPIDKKLLCNVLKEAGIIDFADS